MKFYQKVGLVLLLFNISNTCNAQISEKDEIVKIYSIVESFFYGMEWEKQNDNKSRPSEFFVQILSIDSSGKVTGINLLSDDENKDSAFFLLRKMEPSHFAMLQSDNFKGKSIFIPISILTLKDADFNSSTSRFIKDAISLRKQLSKNAVLLDCLRLFWGVSTH